MRQQQQTILRFLLIKAEISSHTEVMITLREQGFEVVFANIKVQPHYRASLPNDDVIPAYLNNSTACYVEIKTNNLNDTVKKLQHSFYDYSCTGKIIQIEILPKLPSMRVPDFSFYSSGVFQHILSFFQFPSNSVSQRHKDNSYHRWTQQLANQTLNTKSDIQKYSDCPYLLRHYLKATKSWDAYIYMYTHPFWKSQKFFALQAVQQDESFFFQLSPTLQNDKDIIKEACKQFPHLLESIDPKYANDIRIVVPNSNCNYENRLYYASARLRDDKQVVLLMVYNYGRNLQYASFRLRNDYEVVETAVINDASAIEFASEQMKDDYHIMSIVITCQALLLRFASKRLQNDPQLVTSQLYERNVQILRFTKIFANDKSAFLYALQQNGTLLEVASPSLQNDKEVVKVAVLQNLQAFQFASKQLQQDRELIFSIACANVDIIIPLYKLISEELRQDKQLVLKLIPICETIVPLLSPQLKDDKEIMLTAVRTKGIFLQYASNRLTNDREIVLAAISQENDRNPLFFASQELSQDEEIKNISRQFYKKDLVINYPIK